MNSKSIATERTDTAHHHWDKLWQVDEGRADWLEPDPDVVTFAESRFAAGDRLRDVGDGRQPLRPRRTPERGGGRNAEMTALPYDDHSFDYVLSFNVIYHGDPTVVRRAIAEIARVLKPGSWHWHMIAERAA